MGNKKEERKERREDRREERRRRSDQGENSWNLGELEPAVVTADATRDGGSISASEVAAKGKTMPNLQGKAVVQNPSQMEIRYNNPEMPQYGGALDASSAQAERKSMPSMQGKAEVQNPSDIGEMPNLPQYGGQLPTSGVRAEGRAMPNIQGKATAMNPSDIGRMPNPPQYGGELSAATIQAEGRNLPNMQGRAKEQNPSDIGRMPNSPQYGGEIASSEVNAEGKKINEPKAQAEALTKAGISQKRYIPDAVPAEPAEPVATQTKEPAVTSAPANPELDALGASHQNQMDALRNYNQQQYNNLGEIISAADAKMKEAQQKDEKARKRENAFRYISGLGDTLSSIANLVGTAHGASHQKQHYNSSDVVKKAEEARKARKLEMDDLSKRLDEMKTRQMELKAAGSLKEAELKVAQDKERAKLLADQRKAEEEKRRFDENLAYRKERDKVEDAQRDRTFNAQQEQIKQTQQNWQKTYDLQLRKFNEEQKGNKYNFTFSDGSIDIPKEKINDANIERIYQMLPEEVRKTVKGEQFIEYGTDEYGTQTRTTAHKAPSLTQKLAAIASYADNDNAIKNELRALSGMKRTQSAQTTPPQQNPNNPGTAGTQKKTITGW